MSDPAAGRLTAPTIPSSPTTNACDPSAGGCGCDISTHPPTVRNGRYSSRCRSCGCPGYVTPLPPEEGDEPTPIPEDEGPITIEEIAEARGIRPGRFAA